MKTKIFITALAIVLSAGLATAQNQNQNQDQDNKQVTTTSQIRPAFVDNDNSIYDRRE